MMKICNVLLVILFIHSSAYAQAGLYEYSKGNIIFEVKETEKNYEVLCRVKDGSTYNISQNKNITDRQYRIQAIDLIGAYIVFNKEYPNISSNYFQIITDGIDLHYQAVVDGMRSEIRKLSNKEVVCYIFPKASFNIERATYKKNVDLLELLIRNYSLKRSETSASLLYSYGTIDCEHYVDMEKDFLSGNAILPKEIVNLQNVLDRFELSVFSLESVPQDLIKSIANTVNISRPYSTFILQELVTSVPIEQKDKYYDNWKQSIRNGQSLWEDVLFYSSSHAITLNSTSEISFNDIIIAYPGAISPYGIRQPINNNKYLSAVDAYSKLQFEYAIEILTESINNEGISNKTLNLLGASYRLSNKPNYALPYLLLCFKLNPKTEYLVGNIVSCLQMLNYPKIVELCKALEVYVVDEWSKKELLNIMANKN